MKTTAEENKAAVQGSIAYYGTYTVDEVDNTHGPAPEVEGDL
jgi:hypothetical protein